MAGADPYARAMNLDIDALRSQPSTPRPVQARLTPLQPGSRHQREKLAVLSAFADQAMVQAQGFDAAPSVVAIVRWAAQQHPALWTWQGDAATAVHLATRVSLAGEVERLAAGSFGLGDEVSRCIALQPPAWRLPALLALAFEEDLLLVDGDACHIRWALATLPSHWAPEAAGGRALAEQWPHWAAADPAAAPLGRVDWRLTDHPRLHAHPRRVAPDDGSPPGWLRVEQQTLLPLPGVRARLFTTRVALRALGADDLLP